MKSFVSSKVVLFVLFIMAPISVHSMDFEEMDVIKEPLGFLCFKNFIQENNTGEKISKFTQEEFTERKNLCNGLAKLQQNFRKNCITTRNQPLLHEMNTIMSRFCPNKSSELLPVLLKRKLANTAKEKDVNVDN